MNHYNYPILYQLNSRVWLTKLSAELGKKVTLDDVPDAELDRLKAKGVDWLWLLSVWTTGEKSRQVSQQHPGWQKEFAETLPDLKPDDIGGSGFAIADYKVHPAMGGNESLQKLRKRLMKRGIKLMLDFVPNHMGPDHAWANEHPEYFVLGTEDDLLQQPQNFTRMETAKGNKIFAYGRDPYFDGWPDTLQLDYSNPETVAAMQAELLHIAALCDGVRCDMAMLVLPEVFQKTWGRLGQSFWPEIIARIRYTYPAFCLMAEVYWDMEYNLQQLGFDYTYDKRLYDRLHDRNATQVREHLNATLTFQQHSVRFLENHDEARAAATFELPVHLAAAIITYTVPGLHFFHHGQMQGFTKRISPHLVRGPEEAINGAVLSFYQKLLAEINQPVYRSGEWMMLECRPVWEGNTTCENFIAYTWQDEQAERFIVVNYAPQAGQCYLQFPWPDMADYEWRLTDQMGDNVYDRNGTELHQKGLYLDLLPWHYHVFDLSRKGVDKNRQYAGLL